MKSQVYRQLAASFQAYCNCVNSAQVNSEWESKHRDRVEWLCRNKLPHGSGVDNGVKFDFNASKPDKLVFTFGFHHMDEHGYYDGWTEHKLILRPCFVSSFDMQITGRDRNQIKEYLYQTFDYMLREEFENSEFPK